MAKSSKLVAKALSKLAKQWSKTEVRKGATPIEDDQYTAKISSAAVTLSKAGNLMAQYELLIQDGDYDGRKIRKFDMLQRGTAEDTIEALGWFKGSLEAIGIDCPDDTDEVADVLKEAVGKVVSISVVTKGESQNVYFNDLVEDAEESDDDEVAGDDDAEDDDEVSDDDDTDEDDDEEEDDEDDEEDEPAPKPVKKHKK